jgi:hypothetical protein
MTDPFRRHGLPVELELQDPAPSVRIEEIGLAKLQT